MTNRTGNPTWVDYPATTTLESAAALNAFETAINNSVAVAAPFTVSGTPSAGQTIVASGAGAGSWALPGGGKNWLSGIWGLPGVTLSATISNESTTANTLYIEPFYISGPGTVTDIGINVGTAGTAATNARLGIFSKDASGSSWTLVNDAGTVLIDTTGDKILSALTVSLANAGMYGAAVLPQSACSLNSRASGLPLYGAQSNGLMSSNVAVYYSASQAYGALPSTTSPSGGGGFSSSMHRVLVKLA